MSNELKGLLEYSHTLNVLFAEDNYDVRIQLIKLFENFFSKIDVEVDGLSALEKFESFNEETGRFYDLVITDLSMPKLDGIDFCKKLIYKNPNQLILVISAHTESSKLLELIDIGIYKFLQKPVNYKDLLNTLSSIISKIKREKSYLELESEVKNIKNDNQVLNKLAITDKLTSIYNRRYIDSKLLEKFSIIQKDSSKELSIIFIDIDNFKSINDNFGHLVGDNILTEFAKTIKSNIRENEIIGRWGGEEFIVICECKLKNAIDLAEKLRKIIEEKEFDSVGKLTASFGLSSYEESDNISILIQKADYSLYKAKREGKNRVVFIESLNR